MQKLRYKLIVKTLNFKKHKNFCEFQVKFTKHGKCSMYKLPFS